MRFTRFPILPYLVDADITEFEEVLGDNIPPQEKISEAFYGNLMKYIRPGDELVVVILRANELSYKEIAFVMGKKKGWVESVIYRVKRRLEEEYLPTIIKPRTV